MKALKLFTYSIGLLICFSCGTESTTIDSNTDDVDPLGGNETVELINAFPNLSFSQPLDFQSPRDGSNRVFVAEKTGAILVFNNDETATEADIFLDLRGNISTLSEQGLLGFAFHPNFESNGYVFVCYNPSPTLSVISRFTVSNSNTNSLDLNSELILIEIPQPATNHNGGQVAFGPDNYLYIALGDGGGAGDPNNNAQNKMNLLGSILRIDVDNTQEGLNYAIPSDNPFVGSAIDRPEIYAYGFRNPWRMSFDTSTGRLWAADVGQNQIEEIDIVGADANYGWRLFEGTSCFSGDCDNTDLVAPIFEYNQNNGDMSITGGYVYRGELISSLQGKYIYGDFVSGRIWSLTEDGSDNELLFETGLNIASFGTDANEELYLCTFNGSIFKFTIAKND